jgi:hypothetical protein
MTFPYPHPRLFRAALAAAALLLAGRAPAAEIRFLEGLSTEERDSIGISKLAPAQAAGLDKLVSHDVTLAEEGGVTGFSSAFVSRHTPAERAAAGIGLLSDTERAALDALVARAIALGPPPEQPFVYSPPPAKPAPAAPPPETLVSAPLHAEIHGDVSLMVGGGSHGTSFYGTSLDLNVTDPSGKFTLGVSFDEFRGKGILPLYGPFAPYGPYAAYGPIGPAYVGPPYWGW